MGMLKGWGVGFMTMRLAAIGLLGSARAGLPATERAASSVAHLQRPLQRLVARSAQRRRSPPYAGASGRRCHPP